MKVTGLLAVAVLAFSLTVAGCSGHGSTAGNTTTVLPSVASNSSVPLTVASTPPLSSTLLTDIGLIQPSLAGAPPNQIWVDASGVYPNVLTVQTGTTVTWADAVGGPTFTVVSNGGLFQGSITGSGIPGEQTYSYLFASPGTFGYSIDPINATDSGEVIVTG